MRKNIVILSVAAACLLAVAGCGKKTVKTEHKPELGRYVYLCGGVVHCNKDCSALKNAKDRDGHRIFGMEFIDTADLLQRLPEDVKYCPRCISDSTYEHLQRIYLIELREDIHTFLGRDVSQL